jgi:hydrogenase maturation protease
VTDRRYGILGLGNRLEQDEALGALVIEKFRTDPSLIGGLPAPDTVELIDGGTVGLGLMPYLTGLDGLLVVDVINANREPGDLIDLDGVDVIRKDVVMSVHDLGAGELLGALYVMEAWPRRVRVIGLEPLVIGLGLDLTPPVAAAFPGLIGAILGYLADWQRQDRAGGAGA